MWLEADFLARTSFDYWKLRYEEPVYDEGGERAYMISVAPTMLAVLMKTLPSPQSVFVVDHLIAFAFAALLGTAVVWIGVDHLRIWGAGLAAATILTFPPTVVQVDIGGMDLKMTSLVVVGMLCIARGKYRWALVFSVAAFAMKPTALIFTAALAGIFALQLVVTGYRSRQLDRPLAWLVAAGTALVLAEYLAIQWAGTTASLLEDLNEERSRVTMIHWGGLFAFFKFSPSTVFVIGVLSVVALSRWVGRWRGSIQGVATAGDEQSQYSLVNLQSVGWLTLVGFLLATTIVEVIPRYLTLAQAVVVILLIDSLGKHPRIVSAILIVLTAVNLTNLDSLGYPGRDDPRIVNMSELRPAYRDALVSDQDAARVLDSLPADALVVASEPYSAMFSRPRLGYVKNQNSGFSVTGAVAPGWSNFSEFTQTLPRDAVYVYTPNDLFGNSIVIPPPEPEDEILYDDEFPTPLIVYRKNWSSDSDSIPQMEDWLASWEMPPHIRVGYLIKRNHADEAIEFINSELARDPTQIESLIDSAGWMLELGRSDQAFELARLAIEANPDSEKGRSMMAAVLVSTGKRVEAETLLRELLEEYPENVDANYLMGMIALTKGQLDTATEYLEQCIAGQPAHATALSSLGRITLMQASATPSGQEELYQEALALYDRALQVDPSEGEFSLYRGMILEELSREDEAIEAYRQASRSSTPSIEALERLIWLLAAHPQAEYRDESDALEEAQRLALLAGADNLRVLDTLAMCSAATGEFDAAIRYATRARELASRQGNQNVVRQQESRLQAYRSGQRLWLANDTSGGS